MKDLYTFDQSQEKAQEAYQAVVGAYNKIFTDLEAPFIVAEADSGTIGGSFSHEYHYAHPSGEATVWKCDSCGYTANDEVIGPNPPSQKSATVKEGDNCFRCSSGKLSSVRTIEVGHTFFLGDKYSKPLGLTYLSKEGKESQQVEMGCYGIGVSRLIGALASMFMVNSKTGGLPLRQLRWPKAIAPFQAVIIYEPAQEEIATQIYDKLCHDKDGPQIDAILDDRASKKIGGIGWMAQRADLIGYPNVLVVGRAWVNHQKIEVRRMRGNSVETQDISLDDLPAWFQNDTAIGS